MSVQISDFGKASNGVMVKKAVLKNDILEVHILSFGAVIQRILVRDRKGNPVDVVLGYEKPLPYEVDECCVGAVVGRFAGRIKNAEFPLYEETVKVTANKGENCLHSGLNGCHHQIFKMKALEDEEDAVLLTHVSPDGTDGFPGKFTLEVKYSLAGSGLVIEYNATTDAPTVCNITNHSYFNLNGHGSGSVLGHRLSMEAKYYLEQDDTGTPTGRKIPVKETSMDFREEKTIGRDINADYEPLRKCGGYDHCYVIKEEGLRHAAWLTGPATGIQMEVLTTAPGVQLYSANFLRPTALGKDGVEYHKQDAICLEAQDFPNAPNIPEFPDTTLLPDDSYSATTIYRFDIAEQ